MSRTSWWVGLGVPLVLVGGLAAWRTQQALERQAAAEDAVTSGPLPVEVQPAARRSLTAAEMIAGTLRPINEVDVVADVPGRALSVQAEIGDHVAAGAVLATLERDDMEAAVAQARAAVAAAQAGLDAATLDRDTAEKLLASQNMSEVQAAGARARFAAAKAQLEQAQAGLRGAQNHLSDTTIRSPIDGVVTDRSVGVGRMVNPGAPLFHVQDTSSLELELAVDEEVALRMAQGTTVQVIAAGRTVQGSVRVAAPALDARTRRMKVLVTVPPEGLVPYVTAAARVLLEQRDAVSVPVQAVVEGAEGPRVVRVVDGHAEPIDVHVGIRDGGFIEVDGIAEGDRVVIAGAAALTAGAQVDAREPAAAQAEAAR